MKRWQSILILLLLAGAGSGGYFWWRHNVDHSAVSAFQSIENARREVLNSPNDIYVPKEVAADDAIAKYHALEITERQLKVGASLDTYMNFVKFARDNRNRPVRGDNWVRSNAICRGEVALYLGTANVKNAVADLPIDSSAKDGDCFKQRAIRNKEMVDAAEEQVSPMLQALPAKQD
jgi:hypothetical protein